MNEAIEGLKSLMGKVKTEGVKEGVERVAACFNKIAKVRGDLRAEYQAKMDAADRESNVAGTKIVDRVQALEDKVMDVLDQVADKLVVQDAVFSKLAKSTAPPPPPSVEQPWAEVVRRSRGRQTKPVVTPVARAGTVKTPRARPLALTVKLAGEDFPALLKTVRRIVDPGVTGNSINRLKRANAGDLLVEINGGNDSAEMVRAELMHSLGPEARVRKLGNSTAVEIRDLDGLQVSGFRPRQAGLYRCRAR